MHPADELHAIREEIRVLRRREAALRRHFTDGAGVADRQGRRWEVYLAEQRSRQLDPTTLPRQILGDGRFWMEKVSRRVCLMPLGPPPAAAAGMPPPAAAARRPQRHAEAGTPQRHAKAGTPERHAKAPRDGPEETIIDWQDSTV